MWSKLSFGKKVAVFIACGVLINVLAVCFLCSYAFKNGHLPRNFTRLFDDEPVPYVESKENAAKDIKDATAALAKNPKDVSAYAKRAAARELLWDTMGAIADYTKAIDLSPTNADYYSKRGHLLEGEAKPENALKDLERAICLAPGDGSKLYSLAAFYKRRDDFKNAIKNYTAVIKLNHNLREAYTDRAEVYQSMKLFDKAILDYEEALKNDNDESCETRAYEALSRIYIARDDSKNALRVANIWIKDTSKSADSLIFRAKIYDWQGRSDDALRDYKDALAEYSSAIEEDEDSPYQYESRAKLNKALGFKEESISDFKRALELFEERNKTDSGYDASIKSVMVELGELPKISKSKSEKLAEYNSEILKEPTVADHYHDRGQLFEDIGDFVSARKDFVKAQNLDSKNEDFESHIASVDLELKEYARPLKYYEKARFETPEDTDILDQLGLIYNATGKFEKTISVSRRAINLKMTDSAAYNNLGIALQKTGDTVNGRKCLLKALALGYEPD